MRCVECGTPLGAETRVRDRGVNYCGSKCRTAAWRRRRRVAPDGLRAAMEDLAERAEALAVEARAARSFEADSARTTLEHCARALRGTAGMIAPDPLPFDQPGTGSGSPTQ